MAVGLAVGVLVLGGLAFAMWQARGPAQPVHVPAAKPAARFGQAPPPAAAPATVPGVSRPEVRVETGKPTAIGDRFADTGGPAWVLARTATGSRPGLAVMAAPVDKALYQRFAKDRGRKALDCANGPRPAQGCLDRATANELANWLGKQTGEHYRVPTRTELAAGIAQVASAPAYAWTSSCNEVRVARPSNVAKRSWARVRKVFGKPKPVQYDLRCDGHFTLKLDGRGSTAKAQDRATPETVVVLVREVAE
jgi:hypothetical protein